jgi:hypothetical protein
LASLALTTVLTAIVVTTIFASALTASALAATTLAATTFAVAVAILLGPGGAAKGTRSKASDTKRCNRADRDHRRRVHDSFENFRTHIDMPFRIASRAFWNDRSAEYLTYSNAVVYLYESGPELSFL